MKPFAVSIAVLFIWTACGDGNQPIIDREALVERNSPVVTAFDSLASLSVGNGEFAYTVDITGLQTFPDNYKKGVPLGNPERIRFWQGKERTLRYSIQRRRQTAGCR